MPASSKFENFQKMKKKRTQHLRDLNLGLLILSQLCYPLYHRLWLIRKAWKLTILANFQIWLRLALYRGKLQISYFLKWSLSHEMISNTGWLRPQFTKIIDCNSEIGHFCSEILYAEWSKMPCFRMITIYFGKIWSCILCT